MTPNTASLLTDQSILSPAGETDPRADVGLANSTQTCVTVTQDKGLKTLSAVELDAYIQSRALRCSKHVAGFRRRATELYTALIEMERRYNKQQGARSDLHELPAETWTQYVESSGISPATFRKWKSRLNNSMRLLVAPDGSMTVTSPFQAPVVTQDNGVLVDATSAMVNQGYKRANAKQSVEQAISADATLGNNYDGLLRAALARPSEAGFRHSASPDEEPKTTPHSTPTITPTPTVTPEEKDLEQLRYLAERSESLSKALRQIVNGSAKWSKYAEYAEYARLMSAGKEIVGLVTLLGVAQ